MSPIEDAYERLTLSEGVGDVQFNYQYSAHGVPNDPFFGAQWNLQTINTPGVWDYADGSGVVVAVLDSGVGTGGEDLACHTYVDPYNGITNVAGLGAVVDDNGHGTHVTGTIAQCTNNGIETAGAAPGATIMPVKVMDHDAQATTMTLSRGMIWAIEHGADVINLSLGKDCPAPWPFCSDAVIDDLVDRARLRPYCGCGVERERRWPLCQLPSEPPFDHRGPRHHDQRCQSFIQCLRRCP